MYSLWVRLQSKAGGEKPMNKIKSTDLRLTDDSLIYVVFHDEENNCSNKKAFHAIKSKGPEYVLDIVWKLCADLLIGKPKML